MTQIPKHRVVHSLDVVHGDLTGVRTLIAIIYAYPMSMLIDSLFLVKYPP
jgi:hypothetical protein